MKKLIVLFTILIGSLNVSFAEDSCHQPECDNVTASQKKCVLQKYCPEKRLRVEIERLKAENSALRGKYDRLVVAVHSQADQVVERDRNSISLVGAMSQTKLSTESTPTTFNAKTKYQPDLGLMYQHDFDDLRGSIAATLNGTVLLGVGLTF